MIAWLMLLNALATPTTGAEWLRAVDDAATGSTDAHAVLEVTVIDKKGTENQRTIEIWQKGDAQRLVRLTAPARIAGVGLLSNGEGDLHLYLPAYDRVRRIVGDHRGDAFVGSDFTLEDLSRVTWSGDYTAALAANEGDLTLLELTSTDTGSQVSVRLAVQPDMHIARIEHLDDNGDIKRQISLSDFRTAGDRTLAHHIVVEDLAGNRRTVADLASYDNETPVDDDLFTVSRLMRD